MKRRYLILIIIPVAVVLSAVALIAMIRAPGRLPEQPIAFNHRLHLERVQGIQCQDCHRFVNDHTFAGIPGKQICFECHDAHPAEDDLEAEARQPRFATLMAFATAEGDIPWHRVTTLRDDVFFSHRRHVTVGKIECRRCHPGIPERTSPPTHGPAEMNMDSCIACHEESGTSVDCLACHR